MGLLEDIKNSIIEMDPELVVKLTRKALSDGLNPMVVVENGKRHLNHTIGTTVTKLLQTAAGRMIFAQPSSD